MRFGLRILFEFDVPIGQVEDLFPRGIPAVRQLHADDRVAPETGADHVVPGGGPALESWDDMIQA